MEKNVKKMELTEGSEYKILSLGARDELIETTGVFKGFITIGVDETGVLMELSPVHGEMAGRIRIIPLHVILLIDVLRIKENEKKDDFKDMSHYVG
ncbi:MAG TPA: hypothetical protein ENI36_02725 [Thermoplasmatales archaeon]|nr:hypothetical protein [Thermoplasmatales archaeon]